MNEKCKWEKKKGRKWGVLGLGKPPWCEVNSPLSLPTFLWQEGEPGTWATPGHLGPEPKELISLALRIHLLVIEPGSTEQDSTTRQADLSTLVVWQNQDSPLFTLTWINFTLEGLNLIFSYLFPYFQEQWPGSTSAAPSSCCSILLLPVCGAQHSLSQPHSFAGLISGAEKWLTRSRYFLAAILFTESIHKGFTNLKGDLKGIWAPNSETVNLKIPTHPSPDPRGSWAAQVPFFSLYWHVQKIVGHGKAEQIVTRNLPAL